MRQGGQRVGRRQGPAGRLGGSLSAMLLLVGLLVAAPPLAPAAEAQANGSLVVDSTGDGGDADPGDGRCRTSSGTCTLRAAIQQANATPGPNEIGFALPGGVQRISPGSALPALVDTSGGTRIDGYTQSGATANTHGTASNARILIELVGSGQAHGLRIESAGNTVRGLAVSGFVSNVFLTGEGAPTEQRRRHHQQPCSHQQQPQSSCTHESSS